MEILKQNSLFNSLNNSELSECYSKMQSKTYAKQDYIISQGEEGKALFFIVSGSVEVLQTEKDSSHQHTLTHLGPGDIFGEFSLVDNEKTSSSIRTLETTKVLILSREEFNSLDKNSRLYNILSQNLLKQLVKRARHTNTILIRGLKREIHHKQAQLVAGNFMIGLLIIISLFTFLLSSLVHLTQILGTAAVITIPVLFIIFLLFLFGMKRSGYPMSFYGFTLRHWKPYALEGILFSIPILILMTLLKWVLHLSVPAFSEFRLFNLGGTGLVNKEGSQFVLTMMALGYIFISSPIQEILFRGGLQSTLQAFLLGKNRFLVAIITSNIIFAVMHLVLSARLTLLVFFVGLFWGWLYKRQGSLVGVILSHILIGCWAFFILGIQNMIIPL